MNTLRVLLPIFLTFTLSACIVENSNQNRPGNQDNSGNQNNSGNNGGTNNNNGNQQTVKVNEADPRSSKTGCGSVATGNIVEGTVYYDGIKGDHITVPMQFPPCGKGSMEKHKKECGTGHGMVLLCKSPDCSAENDPVAFADYPKVKMQQTSMDKMPFKFCGVENGDYWILPVIDHDNNQKLSELDYTMGQLIPKTATGGWTYPARVEGLKVDVRGNVLLNDKNKAPRVNFLNHNMPQPTWENDGILFAGMHLYRNKSDADPNFGIRLFDLEKYSEIDRDATSEGNQGWSLATDKDSVSPVKASLVKIAEDPNTSTVFYAAASDSEGVQIIPVTLRHDGIEQGHSIRLAKGLFAADVPRPNKAAYFTQNDKTYLAITFKRKDSAPLPHDMKSSPSIVVVEITGFRNEKIDISDSKNARYIVLPKFNEGHAAMEYPVVNGLNGEKAAIGASRFDEIVFRDGTLIASESAFNSKSLDKSGKNRLLLANFSGGKFNAVSLVVTSAAPRSESCGSQTPYDKAGLFVGKFASHDNVIAQGSTTEISFFTYSLNDNQYKVEAIGPKGVDAKPFSLDKYGIGYSYLLPSRDSRKLYVIPECKSPYHSKPAVDWADKGPESINESGRTISRRRIAVLDLTQKDALGYPVVDETVGDSFNVPDVVQEGFSGTTKTLSETIVAGLEFDCRSVMWDNFRIFGFSNVAGAQPGSGCVASVARDAVVTDKALFIIGKGTGFESGMGAMSEIYGIDLKTGRAFIRPGYKWFNEGSTAHGKFGFIGIKVGAEDTLQSIQGLSYLPPKNDNNNNVIN